MYFYLLIYFGLFFEISITEFSSSVSLSFNQKSDKNDSQTNSFSNGKKNIINYQNFPQKTPQFFEKSINLPIKSKTYSLKNKMTISPEKIEKTLDLNHDEINETIKDMLENKEKCKKESFEVKENKELDDIEKYGNLSLLFTEKDSLPIKKNYQKQLDDYLNKKISLSNNKNSLLSDYRIPQTKISKSILEDFHQHTKQLESITTLIHSNMLKNSSEKSNETLNSFNALREKLAKISLIYKKKYPSCLPIPIEVIEMKEDEKSFLQTDKCKYAFYLGDNFTINYLNIIKDLKMTKKEAWLFLKKSYDHSKSVIDNKEEKKKIQLDGFCFAKGMIDSFKKNYQLSLNKNIQCNDNPEFMVERQIQDLKFLINKIENELNKK